MPEHAITIVSVTPDVEQARLAWKRIASAWPAGDAPSTTVLRIDQALAEPRDVLGGAVVLPVDPGVSESLIYKLVDSQHDTSRPTLMLTPPGDDRFDGLQSESVLAAPANTDGHVLAAMLNALLVRQRAVDQLVRELGAVRRFQGGLRDEIDRMHEEMVLASNVQQQMLPQAMPEDDRFDFGVLFRPAGYVSGDIYDAARIDDRHIGFFLADAVGHGVPAALLTVVLRRALVMSRPDDAGVLRHVAPAEALTRINEALLRSQGSSTKFATAVYGVIDTHTRTITMAAAGHPAPLLIRAGQEAKKVESEGCLLGVFPEPDFEEITLTLEPEDVLLIYSDGFETAFPVADEYQPGSGAGRANDRYLDHFAALCATGKPNCLRGAIGTLQQELDGQIGSLHQVDDLTALLVAAKAESPNVAAGSSSGAVTA